MTATRAANIVPHFTVSLLHTKHNYFFKYLDEMFLPRLTHPARLNYLFASVDQLLVRRTRWYRSEYLMIVLKPGIAIPATQEARRYLVMSVAIRLNLHHYTCLVHADAAGSVGHGVDVLGNSLGKGMPQGANAHRLRSEAKPVMPPGFVGFMEPIAYT